MRILRFIWQALNNMRRMFQLLIMFLLIALIVVGVSEQGIEVPDSAALVIAPHGELVEQLAGDPVERAIAEARGIPMQQTLVHDVIDSLELAAEDDRIQAVVLELDGLTGGGLAKLQAVAKSIERVRDAGKLVIANGDNYSQDQYFIAAHADEVYLADLGMLFIDGYGYYRGYFTDALEKLKVDVNVFRVGEYKSFVEPFTRMDMSAADREAGERWLGALWSTYTRDVEAVRGLDAGSIDSFANNLVQNLRRAGGDPAQAALEAKLVDVLGDRRAYVERVMDVVGPSETDEETFSAISVGAYLEAVRRETSTDHEDDSVGVLIAAGQIVDGQAPRGTIGGDTLAALVSQAADDDSIKALVLRVDSPGGSMFASEVVFDELQRLRSKGKPLVVSMSSTAASGGYYIAMLADEIWASESTITGSIGVGALIPTFQRALGSLGVNIDGVGTTDLSGQLRMDRELGEDVREAFQLSVERAYNVFLGKVAESRDMSRERVENIARGRVWIGSDALELGLIDQLGDLDDAIESAASKAGLDADDFGVQYVEPELSFRERIALEIAATAVAFGGNPDVALGRLATGWAGTLIRSLEQDVGWLMELNDPRSLYYHCLCQLN